MSQFSIAICPPPDCIAYVSSMKDALANIIGWYHSRNSSAHISILEISIEESSLEKAIKYLERFCQQSAPFTIHFNSFGTFPNGAFFLEPDIESRNKLVPVMKAFSAKFPFRSFKSSNPHMTIARRLDNTQLEAAKSHFATVNPNITFEVGSLCLRKWNVILKQYEIIKRFYLLGNSGIADPIVVQGNLF